MKTLLLSPFTDPYLNLALESYFLETLRAGEEYLFLYINEPAVVIGRFQNPWLETLPRRGANLKPVRRQSGGGTVYHDPGNLNFSFIQFQKDYNPRENLKTISAILKNRAVYLTPGKRHDLFAEYEQEQYKVSGSAFRHKKDRAFHHGTLLVSTRLHTLTRLINRDETKIFLRATGTPSHKSPVINLNQLVPGLTIKQVVQAFRQHYEQENPGPIVPPKAPQWLSWTNRDFV